MMKDSEMSVSINQTTRWNIPEDSHFHARRRAILKYHISLTSGPNAAIL
jgi:hypothetical protein